VLDLGKSIQKFVKLSLNEEAPDGRIVDVFALSESLGLELVPSVYTYGVQNDGRTIYFNPRMEKSDLQQNLVSKILLVGVKGLDNCLDDDAVRDSVLFTVRKFSS